MEREKALEIVGKMKLSPGKDADLIIALHTLIPELRESEDEKFRKYILRACEECIENDSKGLELSMDTTKKLASYLEKQKEQKPKNILTDDDSLQTAYLKGQTDVFEDPEAYGLQKEPKHAPDYLQKVFEAGQTSIVDNPEKYGLCKKAVCSKTDKEYLRLIHQAISCAYVNKALDAQTCSILRKWFNKSWL